jgi:hypothetical protein
MRRRKRKTFDKSGSGVTDDTADDAEASDDTDMPYDTDTMNFLIRISAYNDQQIIWLAAFKSFVTKRFLNDRLNLRVVNIFREKPSLHLNQH